MTKQPLGVFEFDMPLDEMDDEQIDQLAGAIAEVMAANLRALPRERPAGVVQPASPTDA